MFGTLPRYWPKKRTGTSFNLLWYPDPMGVFKKENLPNTGKKPSYKTVQWALSIYSRGKFHQKFRYHKYEKKKTLWITNRFFFSPVPKAKITHQENWIQTTEVIWFLVNMWYCGWKKRKLENLLKCNLKKKAQIMGKIAKVSRAQNWKKKNTVANTSITVFFLGANFRTVPTK